MQNHNRVTQYKSTQINNLIWVTKIEPQTKDTKEWL